MKQQTPFSLFLLVLLTFLFQCGYAEASWQFSSSYDQGTGEPVASAYIDSDSKSAGLLIKCWNDSSRSEFISIILNIDVSAIDRYPESTTAIIKTDANIALQINLARFSDSPRVAFITGREIEAHYEQLRDSLNIATETITIELLGDVYRFNLNGRRLWGSISSICPYMKY